MQPQTSKRRFRGFLLVVLLLVGLWAALWGAASLVAPRLLAQAMPRLEAQLQGTGIRLAEALSVSTIRVSPWLLGVELRGLRARLDLNAGDRIDLRSGVLIEVLELRLTHLIGLRGRVRAEGVEVRLDPSDRPTALPFDQFSNASAMIGDLPWRIPDAPPKRFGPNCANCSSRTRRSATSISTAT